VTVIKNTSVLRWLVVLSLVPAIAACALDPAVVKAQPGKEADPPETRGFSVATFNTGLAHGAIPYADERRELMAGALGEMATDVLCLQEVWTDEDAEAIASAVKSAYPFAYRTKTAGRSPKAARCGLFKALKLDRCVKSRCASEGISILECVNGICRDRYEALGEACQRCLASNPDQSWRCASDLFRSDEFVYEGANGLMLLSRHRIERPKFTSFDTVLIKRGVISATIKGRSIFCTHLTVDLDAVPYPHGRSYGSFREEQADQLDWIASVAPTDRCTIVLGDFNNGPSSESLTGELAEHYASMLAKGFVEPWSSRRCTFCSDNPLAGSQDDLQLDHILFRQCPEGEIPRYSRILDRAHELEAGGSVREIRLSDHYGLRLDWEERSE
jgi:endonuclease/exonuclease/phosphatase family metal-dependent hydrolase